MAESLPTFSRQIIHQLFHEDFQQHKEALKTLASFVNVVPDSLIDNLDLVLKWTTLRFFESNPTILLQTLGYLSELLSVLASQSYSLLEFEANSFIPNLAKKVLLLLQNWRIWERSWLIKSIFLNRRPALLTTV